MVSTALLFVPSLYANNFRAGAKRGGAIAHHPASPSHELGGGVKTLRRDQSCFAEGHSLNAPTVTDAAVIVLSIEDAAPAAE